MYNRLLPLVLRADPPRGSGGRWWSAPPLRERARERARAGLHPHQIAETWQGPGQPPPGRSTQGVLVHRGDKGRGTAAHMTDTTAVRRMRRLVGAVDDTGAVRGLRGGCLEGSDCTG
eukprot:1178566-Prorocentrum_minimum.AAC.2